MTALAAHVQKSIIGRLTGTHDPTIPEWDPSAHPRDEAGRFRDALAPLEGLTERTVSQIGNQDILPHMAAAAEAMGLPIAARLRGAHENRHLHRQGGSLAGMDQHNALLAWRSSEARFRRAVGAPSY